LILPHDRLRPLGFGGSKPAIGARVFPPDSAKPFC
jgi:hypothetical protein